MGKLTTQLFVLGLAGAAFTVLAGRAERSEALRPAPSRSAYPEVQLETSAIEMSRLEATFPESVSTKAELRDLITRTRAAEPSDAAALRGLARGCEDPLVAGNALRALGRMGLVKADSPLAALVGDERPSVRQEAVVALGASGDPASVARLASTLEEGSDNLRLLALHALGEIGGDGALAVLQRTLRDSAASEAERTFARHAIDRAQRTHQRTRQTRSIAPAEQERTRSPSGV